MGEIYLTKEGYERLTEELAVLKTVKRRKISKEIEEARAHGDISENAEYDAAKEAQAVNERKINELESNLSRARVINKENIPKGEVAVGTIVKIKDLDSQEETEYALVSELEADYKQNKISITSPIGKGLIGHKENDIVEINVPAGTLKYKIFKISR
ncbi:MAG: transcription elongation factor GreA [Candidatus Firestonebacteria bacterium]